MRNDKVRLVFAVLLGSLKVKEDELLDWCRCFVYPQVAVVFVKYVFFTLTALPLTASMLVLASFLEFNLGFAGQTQPEFVAVFLMTLKAGG